MSGLIRFICLVDTLNESEKVLDSKHWIRWISVNFHILSLCFKLILHLFAILFLTSSSSKSTNWFQQFRKGTKKFTILPHNYYSCSSFFLVLWIVFIFFHNVLRWYYIYLRFRFLRHLLLSQWFDFNIFTEEQKKVYNIIP